MSDDEAKQVKNHRQKRSSRYYGARMPKFPCGCRAANTNGVYPTMLMKDGTRICGKHGKRYRMAWEEVVA